MYLSGLLGGLSFIHTVQIAEFLPELNLKQLLFPQWIWSMRCLGFQSMKEQTFILKKYFKNQNIRLSNYRLTVLQLWQRKFICDYEQELKRKVLLHYYFLFVREACRGTKMFSCLWIHFGRVVNRRCTVLLFPLLF